MNYDPGLTYTFGSPVPASVNTSAHVLHGIFQQWQADNAFIFRLTSVPNILSDW